ncbi:MAG: hypothetical protein CDV28_11821 [Candidatus Electronema aureum]|uniref:Uncharacterized protein n=1 Tax=Candidatus Electronema aureum TaxID=2005002 RepID=A0A521G155_9BACT|nr:MAG: hypothetical protein CDV28_11821 [Candidatus Electronema aureum]
MIPIFFKKLDQNLRVNYPIVWRTRIHYFFWYLLILLMLTFLAKLFNSNKLDFLYKSKGNQELCMIILTFLSIFVLHPFYHPIGDNRLVKCIFTTLCYSLCFFSMSSIMILTILPRIDLSYYILINISTALIVTVSSSLRRISDDNMKILSSCCLSVIFLFAFMFMIYYINDTTIKYKYSYIFTIPLITMFYIALFIVLSRRIASFVFMFLTFFILIFFLLIPENFYFFYPAEKLRVIYLFIAFNTMIAFKVLIRYIYWPKP